MQESLLSLLVSPTTGAGLKLIEEVRRGDEIVEGRLVCEQTGEEFPIKSGIPRFAPEALKVNPTARRFGFQWTMQGKGKFEKATIYGKSADEELEGFLQVVGLTVEDLPGLKVADVGCGSGRLSTRLAELGAIVLAFDISASIDLVRQRGIGLPNLHAIQADLFNLPLADGSLDVVWSEGVLHHTPAPGHAFSALAKKVVVGGRMGIYVYSQVMSVYRHVRRWTPAVSRWPIELLQVYCYVTAMLIYLARIITGRRQSYPLVHFMLFDTLACPYLSMHSKEEVTAWYEAHKFDEVQIIQPYISAVGTKTSSAATSSASRAVGSERASHEPTPTRC